MTTMSIVSSSRNRMHFTYRLLLFTVLLFSCTTVFGQYQVNTYVFSTSTTGVLDDVTAPTGTLISSASDDVSSSVVNIGFNFNYAGTVYTQFSVSSNGLLGLGSTAITNTGVNSINTAPNVKIAPYWDDLSTSTTGSVVYKLTGTAPNRKLAIDWYLKIPKNNAQAANAHFQCWLEEATNAITFVYGATIGTNSSGYSVGISNSTTDWSSVSTNASTTSTTTANNGNTVAIASGRTYKFTPGLPTCATGLSPAAGATAVNPTSALSWSPGASGGYPVSYDVYFGTTSTPPLVSSAQAATTYTPASTLAWNTTYYWQVVPRTATGAATGCSVNSFTTTPTLAFDVTRLTGQSYSSIMSTGNTITSWRNGTNTDDNLSNAVPIGFNFVYQGTACSNVLVSTNGFLTFNTGSTANGSSSAAYAYQNTAFSASDATKSVATLAPFWDDISCQGNNSFQAGLNGSIRYLTTGTSPNRIFTVEWSGMEPLLIAGADLNFQVRLYESTNIIEFAYGTMTGFFGNINPSTAPLYNYSLGLNAWNISSTTSVGEVFSQQLHNTRFFKDSTAKSVNNLQTVPECNSVIRFTPGTYTAYVAPSSTVPSNDAPSNAITVAVNSGPCTNLCGGVFSTAGATSSGITAASGGGVADDDVWFKFVATQPAISVRAYGGTNFDPSLEVFSTLPTNTTTRIANSNTIATGFYETVNLSNLTVGNTYYFRVFHYGVGFVASGTLGGDFAVCVYATPTAPINDNCSGAIQLTTGVTCTATSGSSLAATSSTGMTSCAAISPDPAPNSDDDVWFSFQALTTSATVTVQSGYKYNAVIQVFSGSCGSLVSLACKDATKNAQSESLVLSGLTIGATYYVRVYNFTAGAGRGTFSICVTAPPPSCVTGQYPPNLGYNIPAVGTNLSWNRVVGATGYDVYLDTINPPVNLLASNYADTVLAAGFLDRNTTYYYSIQPRNGVGVNSTCPVTFFGTEPPGYNLIIKAFLQGFYTGARTMKPVLNPADTITDTLIVKLYSTTLPRTLNYLSYCLLSVNGYGTAEFPQPALLQSYYVVLEHRNHLETWSSTPFQFDTPDTTYDFTTSASAAYGNNLALLETGVYGLYSGDVNQDDAINLTDFSVVGTTSGVVSTATYRREDLDGDGMVDAADYSWMENRIFLGTILQKP